MEDIDDPRIREIMERLSKGDRPESGKQSVSEKKKEKKTAAPPRTLEEFMAIEKLKEWPYRITSENLLDLSEERELLGKKEDILNELKEATPLEMKMLNEVDDRLRNFEERVQLFAREMIAQHGDDEEASQHESIPRSVNRAFITDLELPSKDNDEKSRPSVSLVDQLQETQRKSVLHCSFPGFCAGELTELPGQLEGPQLLHRITKAQDFNPGFRKFWKKIFQSEASVAMMQDTFWWFFIKSFEKDSRSDQSQLFDRIADSFVALFMTVNPEIKDKVFAVYGDCLAQAVFAAFWEAFPESQGLFGANFKQDLVNTIEEWIYGVKPVPGSWKDWDIKRLEPKHMKSSKEKEIDLTAATQKTRASQSLDMEDFHRTIGHLGGESELPALHMNSTLTRGMSREATKVTGISMATGTTVPMVTGPHGTISRQAQCGTPRLAPKESHQVGPGPKLQRVMFNTQGRSPLVAHYMHMRQLHDAQPSGQRIKRTEVSKMPTEGQTYSQLIQETLQKSDVLSKEYQRVCDETAQEIQRIEQQKIEANHEIERLQREIQFCKKSIEVKVITEQILDQKTKGITTRPSTKGEVAKIKAPSSSMSSRTRPPTEMD